MSSFLKKFARFGWRCLAPCLLLASCAAPVSGLKGTPAQNLSWPSKEHPRVQWLASISDYKDVGIRKGVWQRALEFLMGPDPRRIVRPYGVLFDSQERLFVADPGAGVVHTMDLKEGVYQVIGDRKEQMLRSPIGLAEDKAGRLYITDSGSGAVFRYDPAAKTLLPFPIRGVRRPTGIAYSPFNHLLYVVDTLGDEVIAVDDSGTEVLRFGGGSDADRFNRPTDVYVDAKGKVYVTDPLNYKIKIFGADGTPLHQIGTPGETSGRLNKAKGVAVDSEGHIYICDALLDAVQVFDEEGQFLLTFGSPGTGNGQFWMPSGLYIDSQDRVYVSDTYNRRIQVFRYLAEKGGTGVAVPVGEVKP